MLTPSNREATSMQRLITIFGGSGFVGRHLVGKLAKTGARIRVAVRNPGNAGRLLPMGDPGQIAIVRCNLSDPAQAAEAVRGADAVVNLVGILYETGSQRFDAVQAEGAGNAARAAKAAGVRTFLQMSAIGADRDSGSAYARTKAEGEAQVLEAFPGAIILRPSIIFGPEDGFFNRFGALAASAPVLPLFGGGRTRFQPVYVADVAEAAVRAIQDGRTGVFELGGPEIVTFAQVMDYVCAVTGRTPLRLSVPFALGAALAAVLEWLPVPPLTRDQLRLLRNDNVVTPGVPGLKELGVTPVPFAAVVPSYLYVYRREGQFTDLRLE
jgi:NADH dehydrogenase